MNDLERNIAQITQERNEMLEKRQKAYDRVYKRYIDGNGPLTLLTLIIPFIIVPSVFFTAPITIMTATSLMGTLIGCLLIGMSLTDMIYKWELEKVNKKFDTTQLEQTLENYRSELEREISSSFEAQKITKNIGSTHTPLHCPLKSSVVPMKSKKK